MADHDWIENERGMCCPACGEVVLTGSRLDAGETPPMSCRECGFPDFEDGLGYFTEEDDAS